MRSETCVRLACATVVALWVSAGSARALPASPQQPPPPGPASETDLPSPHGETTTDMTTAVIPRRPMPPITWPRVLIPDPVAHYAARKALDDAWKLLGQPRCGAVVNDLRDRAGRPLVERLDGLSVDVQTYVTLLMFVDGSRERACVTGVMAFTTPGSRVVGLCLDELKRTAPRNPHHAAASVIHEMLHTLGLGEDPPSSQEITRRVLEACQRRP